jgi:hypothetical protein
MGAFIGIQSQRACSAVLQELVTMLNGVEVPDFLTFRTFVMKVIGAVATVAASLPLGYQGVMLHIGGMLASLLATVLPHFELSQGAKRLPGARSPAELGHCMPIVQSTSYFSEYGGEALLPSSKWRKKLPRIGVIVKGIRHHLSGALLPSVRENVPNLLQL